jgi:hypothetical protein
MEKYFTAHIKVKRKSKSQPSRFNHINMPSSDAEKHHIVLAEDETQVKEKLEKFYANKSAELTTGVYFTIQIIDIEPEIR